MEDLDVRDQFGWVLGTEFATWVVSEISTKISDSSSCLRSEAHPTSARRFMFAEQSLRFISWLPLSFWGAFPASASATGQLTHILCERLRRELQPLDHRQIREQLVR